MIQRKIEFDLILNYLPANPELSHVINIVTHLKIYSDQKPPRKCIN